MKAVAKASARKFTPDAGFSAGNHVRFHAGDGRGHAFLAGQIMALDTFDPQVAAHMTRVFDRWKKMDPGRLCGCLHSNILPLAYWYEATCKVAIGADQSNERSHFLSVRRRVIHNQ